MNVLRHEAGIFMSHFPNELSKTNHIPIERGVSCGGTQVLGTFYQFWSSDAKDTPAYLNGGQISGSNGSGCLNLKF